MNDRIPVKDHIKVAVEQLFGNAQGRIKSLILDENAYNLFCDLDNEMFIAFERAPTALLVASTEEGEGCTSIAVLVAVLWALHQPRKKVLLVDADTRNAGASNLFGLPAGDGVKSLNHYFAGNADFGDCIRKSGLENLHVMTASVGEWKLKLSPDRFEDLVNNAKRNYELVIVDSPASGKNKDAASLAKIIRNVLLVIGYGGPKREQINSVISEFRRVNANIIGAVINKRIYPLPRFVYS